MVTTTSPEGMGDPAAPAQKTSWTIMLYIAADSTLANFAVESLKQLNRAARAAAADPPAATPGTPAYEANEADVVVAAQFSIDAPGGQEIKRYIFKKGGQESLRDNHEPALDERNDLSVSEKNALESFLHWVYNDVKPKTDHYALILWSHGPELFLQPPTGGKTGDSASLYLTPEDLRDALKSKKPPTGRKLEIVGFDACSMSMFEMAYEIKDRATLMIASQEEVPDASFPYYDLVQLFRRQGNALGSLLGTLDQGTLDPKESGNNLAPPPNKNAINEALANSLQGVRKGLGEGVKAYLNAYQDYIVGTHTGMNPVTLSVLNLTMCDGSMEAVGELASALKAAKDDPKLPRRLIQARKTSQDYAGGLYVDLHDFCEKLSKQLEEPRPSDGPKDTQNASPEVREKRENIRRACEKVQKLLKPSPASLILINGAVTETGTPLINDKNTTANHGISIYLPYLTDRQFDDTVNRPLVKGGRGTNGGKGIPNALNAAAGDYLLSTLQTLILATENYYGDLQLSAATEWYSFITDQWTKAIAYTDPAPKFRYSARQIEINLGWEPKGAY